MFVQSLMALLLTQVNPGLPPPNPTDGPFDVSSVCYVVMTAEADRLHALGKDTRYDDAASGFFAAQVAQVHAGREAASVSQAVVRIGDEPSRFLASCADSFAVGTATFSRFRSKLTRAD